MGRTQLDGTYLEAFHAAIAQREEIYAEFERLKNRRMLIETAARTLEPLVYPDEYLSQEAVQSEPESQTHAPVVEISPPAASAEIWNPTIPVEVPAPAAVPQEAPEAPRPVQAVTQVYVRGDGEPDVEIQRRINIAIGRSAAD
jgi:hypothetical protein